MSKVLWSVLLASSAVVLSQYLNTTPSCLPAKPDHSDLTGEALYKQLHVDYATWLIELDKIAAANPGKPLNNDTGYFLSLVLEGQQNAVLIGDISSGKQPANEANCLTVVNATVTQINGVILHASDVIPGAPCDKLTGEGRYQYILQQLGQVFVQLFAFADANANAQNPGKWLQNIIDAAGVVRTMQTVANGQAGPFNGTACLSVLKADANSFNIVVSSLTSY